MIADVLPIASSPGSKKSNIPRNKKMPPSANSPVPICLFSDIIAL